jgi:hypothetical protein
MTLSPGEWQRVHVLTLLESAKTTAAKRAEALRMTLRNLQRLRGKPRSRKRSPQAQP